jgi:hypothetical protein
MISEVDLCAKVKYFYSLIADTIFMIEATRQSRDAVIGKAALVSPHQQMGSINPSAEKMRILIGASAVDQYPDKSWTIITPAGHSIEDAEFAIELGRYKLAVTERIVFVKPVCEKSFE